MAEELHEEKQTERQRDDKEGEPWAAGARHWLTGGAGLREFIAARCTQVNVG